MGRPPLLIDNRRNHHSLDKDLAVLFSIAQLAAPHLAPRERGPHLRIDRDGSLAGFEDPGVAPKHFGGAVAGIFAKSRIHIFDRTAQTGDHHRQRRLLDHAGELPQSLFAPFALRDILLHRHVVARPALGVQHRRDDHQLGDQLTILLLVNDLAAPHLAGTDGSPKIRKNRRWRQARLQRARILATQLGERVTAHGGKTRVHILDCTRQIRDDDRHRTLLDHLGKLTHLSFRPTALRDVLEDNENAVRLLGAGTHQRQRTDGQPTDAAPRAQIQALDHAGRRPGGAECNHGGPFLVRQRRTVIPDETQRGPVQALAPQLVRRPRQDPAGRRIGVRHHSVRPDIEHAEFEILEEHMVLLFVHLEFLAQPLGFGDVGPDRR